MVVNGAAKLTRVLKKKGVIVTTVIDVNTSLRKLKLLVYEFCSHVILVFCLSHDR